ncbi:shikimate kinase [bacterium]|nr:shikimate kinase [bacterium]
MKTVCLAGMMGAGKTSVSKILSDKLNMEILDIDFIIEQKEGMKISEIFAQKGENYFRYVEQNTIVSVLKNENQVISLGGGAFENEKTRKFLLENSTVIYLETSAEVIFERIKNDVSRPLLCDNMSVEKIKEILGKRVNNYKFAQITINTDGKSQIEIADEIIGVLNYGS